MNLTEARTIGRNAYLAGESSAPALNAEIIAAITGLPVGGGALEIMRAFGEGWSAENFAAVVA